MAPHDPIDEPAPTDREHLRTRAAKGVLWTATSNWAEQLTALVVFTILARLLVPEAFGLVALALVFVGFSQVIADQGLADALVQRKELDRAHLDSAFWMSIALGVAFAAILAGLAIPVAALLDQDQLAPVVAALSLAIPIGSLSLVQRAILTREMAFRSLALRTLVSIAVGGAVGVTAAALGLGVWSLVAQNLAAPIAGVVVLWSVSEWRPGLSFSRRHFKDLFAFGIHVVGFRLLNYFTRRSDELLIGSFLGPASLGFYTIGYRMLRLLLQVSSSLIDKVAFPLYSRLQDEETRRRRAYYKSTSFAALIAFPTFIGAIVLAPQIVVVLFGEKWVESVPIMRFLALLGVIQLLSHLNSTLIRALGKPSWQVVIVAVTSVLKVIAFLIAVQFGIVAVAVASACVGYVMAPAYFWAVNRLIAIEARQYVRHIAGPLAASALGAGAVVGVQHVIDPSRELLTLAVGIAVGALAYVATVRVLARPLTEEALELARRALPTRAHGRPARAGGQR